MLIVSPVKLVDAMIARRHSCKSLGRAAGVSPMTVSRLSMSGGKIRLDTLAKLAATLNVDYRQLLKEDSNPDHVTD